MSRIVEEYNSTEFKFLNFSDVLKNIRDEFLSDSDWLEHDIVAKTNGRTPKKWIRHFSVEEVLKLYEYIDITKTNAVLIPNDIHIDSHGLIDDDGNFTTISIKSLDGCKRMVPLLIKNIDCSFSEISEYLSSGEGQDFILELNCDRDKLRKSICSFKEFKVFARNNGLRHILENLINKREFKRLFIS